jgi:agmatinase
MDKPKCRKSMEKFQKILVPTVYDDVPTFLGVPPAKTKNDLRGADAAILGVPSQSAQMLVGREIGLNILDTMRLRKASLKYGSFLPELDMDVFEKIRLVDCGDLTGFYPATETELLGHFKLAEKRISEILGAGCVPLTIGAYPYVVARALDGRNEGKIGILHLDAHGDNLEEHEGSKWSFACWVSRASELRNVDMKNYVQIGMRGPRNFKEQVEWHRKKGSTIYTYKDMKEKGIEKVTEEAIKRARSNVRYLFLNVDYDVLDLGTAPGLDEPLGITTADLLALVYKVGENKVTAFNVEWIPTPAWEPYRLPAWPLYWIVTWTILYLLAGMARGKG